MPADQAADQQVESTAPEAPEESQTPAETGPVSSSLVPSGSMELAAAREFTVDYYEGGYAVIWRPLPSWICSSPWTPWTR